MMGFSEGGVILCNRCEKRISAKGIQIRKRPQGEYQVSFFTCFHCGALYQITTTDKRQRELMEERDRLRKKVVLARKKKFRDVTIAGYLKQIEEKEKQLEKRAGRLRAIGEEILHPKEAEEHGQENGQGGADGV